MAWTRYSRDLLPTNDQTDSITDNDIESLFDGSDNKETDIISDANTEINNNTDDNILLFEDEE